MIYQIYHGEEAKDFTVPFKFKDIKKYIISTTNEIGSGTISHPRGILYGKYSGIGILIALILIASYI